VRSGFGRFVRPLRRDQASEADGRYHLGGGAPTAREDRARRRVRISGGSKALKAKAQECCQGETNLVGSVGALVVQRDGFGWRANPAERCGSLKA
jgi:hypothetical protein